MPRLSVVPQPPLTASSFVPTELGDNAAALRAILSVGDRHGLSASTRRNFTGLLEESAVLLVQLATSAQNYTVQQRFLADISIPALRVPSSRLQEACGDIVRRLFAALELLPRPRSTERDWYELTIAAANGALVRASAGELMPSQALPIEVARSVAAALALESSTRRQAPPHLLRAAGSAVALFAFAGAEPPADQRSTPNSSSPSV